MTKLTISNSKLVNAVKKASISMGDAFVLSVLPKDVGNGMRQGSLASCNGNTQANIYLPVQAEDDACGEYVFGREFGQIVQTLSAYDAGDFVIRRKDDGTCTITCGGSIVPIPTRDSATRIRPKDPNECNSVIVECPAESFKRAVERAGCAYSSTIGGKYEIVRNAMNVTIEKAGERYGLWLVTTDGVIASGAYAPIAKQKGLDESRDNNLALSLNATVFTKIAGMVSGTAVTLYLAATQVMINDGYDVYIIVPNASVFPASIGKMLWSEPQLAYSFKVNKKRLIAAMDIALLSNGGNEASKINAGIVVEDEKVTVTSLDGGCRSNLDAETVTGAIRIGINVSLAKRLLMHMGETIRVFGGGASMQVYICDEMKEARCFIAPATFGSGSSATGKEDSES